MDHFQPIVLLLLKCISSPNAPLFFSFFEQWAALLLYFVIHIYFLFYILEAIIKDLSDITLAAEKYRFLFDCNKFQIIVYR